MAGLRAQLAPSTVTAGWLAGKGEARKQQWFLAGLAYSLDRALRGRLSRASRRRHSCRWCDVGERRGDSREEGRPW